jgi:hypothetical protein
VLLLNECLLLLLFISLSTQSGNFWIHPRISTNASYFFRSVEQTGSSTTLNRKIPNDSRSSAIYNFHHSCTSERTVALSNCHVWVHSLISGKTVTAKLTQLNVWGARLKFLSRTKLCLINALLVRTFHASCPLTYFELELTP